MYARIQVDTVAGRNCLVQSKISKDVTPRFHDLQHDRLDNQTVSLSALQAIMRLEVDAKPITSWVPQSASPESIRTISKPIYALGKLPELKCHFCSDLPRGILY